MQNSMVLATNPRPAVVELITGWYGGVPGPPPTLPNARANDKFVPGGWLMNNKPFPIGKLMSDKLYLNVVRTCRTCHTADVTRVGGQYRTWRTYEQFKKGKSRISEFACGASGNDMPHVRSAI